MVVVMMMMMMTTTMIRTPEPPVAADDDGGGGGGDDDDDDDDDDDNDNDDNYDNDDDAFFRDLKVASRTSRTTLMALQVSAEQSVGWMTAMPSSTNPAYCIQIGQAAKTLTDDCSALYWTQELGLTCLESGRRAASNEPSCFSRR